MFRVPLHFAAIPEKEILNACNRFNLPLETWRRQERAFGLLRKVYAKRAAIRGQELRPNWPQHFRTGRQTRTSISNDARERLSPLIIDNQL